MGSRFAKIVRLSEADPHSLATDADTFVRLRSNDGVDDESEDTGNDAATENSEDE